MKHIRSFLAVLLLVLSNQVVLAQGSSQPSVFTEKPGWTNWYAIDTNGDDSPDILTKDRKELDSAGRPGAKLYIVQSKNTAPPIQVHVVERDGGIFLNMENEGTEHPKGEKVLRVKKK